MSKNQRTNQNAGALRAQPPKYLNKVSILTTIAPVIISTLESKNVMNILLYLNLLTLPCAFLLPID